MKVETTNSVYEKLGLVNPECFKSQCQSPKASGRTTKRIVNALIEYGKISEVDKIYFNIVTKSYLNHKDIECKLRKYFSILYPDQNIYFWKNNIDYGFNNYQVIHLIDHSY